MPWPRPSPRFDQPVSARRSAIIIALCALCLALGLWLSVALADPVSPTQRGALANQELVSSGNTPASPTIAPGTTGRAHIYRLDARCSAGSATLSITNNGVQQWSTAVGSITTTNSTFQWNPPFTGGLGQTVGISLSGCGAGNYGTLDVQADSFGP